MGKREIICSVERCKSAANRVGHVLCEKHYMRKRRHGSFHKKSTLKHKNLTHTGGYVLIHAPNHPLRKSSNRLYEHRVVYYDAHGAGPFKCNWCDAELTWDDLHIDHLNDVVTDNRIENLVASCPVCNVARGRNKMIATRRAQSTRRYKAHGKDMCLSEWARYLGISTASINYRIKKGWPLDKALSPRIGKSGPPSRERPTNNTNK